MGPENSLDKDKALKSLDKLFDIFKENLQNLNAKISIILKSFVCTGSDLLDYRPAWIPDEIFKTRCPYKNAKSRWNAKISIILKSLAKTPVCTGSDLLDYRPAWIPT